MQNIAELVNNRSLSITPVVNSTRAKRRQWLLDEFIQRMPGYSASYVCSGINSNPWTKETSDNRNDDELEYVLNKAKQSKNFIAYFKWMFYPKVEKSIK